MNQIIYPEKIENNIISYRNYLLKKKHIYKFLFLFSIIISLFFIIYYIFLCIKLNKIQNTSKNILSIYDIQKLYSQSTSFELPSIVAKSGEIADVLGIIQIDKINLRLPILSKCSDDLLSIAPCKYSGTTLNGYGNFCIAGHNYDNDQFFSNLPLLQNGDIIKIYSLERFWCGI